jgi:hypothetical protein
MAAGNDPTTVRTLPRTEETAMFRDDAVQLQAEALGVLRSLRDNAVGVRCQQSLDKAYEVLVSAGVDPQRPPSPAEVGAHRRVSDFKVVQELLLQLSWCDDVVRKDVILTMMYVTKAESEWVTAPPTRKTRSGVLRRKSDVAAPEPTH